MIFLATIHWIWEVTAILGILGTLFVIHHLWASEAAGAGETGGPSRSPAQLKNEFIVWLAQGFGVGRVLIAPGTFGSVVGILWFLLLLRLGNFWGFAAGILVGIAVSIWICGRAERILNKKDPGSIVLDEIVGLPVCFLPWVASQWWQGQTWPTPESFFQGRTWLVTALVFILFRIFDVLKPWPIRSSQRLHGGLGVTIDDVLAGVYVALLSLLFVL